MSEATSNCFFTHDLLFALLLWLCQLTWMSNPTCMWFLFDILGLACDEVLNLTYFGNLTRSVGWSFGQSVSRLVGWSVGPLVRWSVGRLVGWSIGWLVGWLVGLLVRRLVSWSVSCFHIFYLRFNTRSDTRSRSVGE